MSDSRVKALPEVRRRSKDRALLVLGVLVYVACFQWMYVHWLYPVFGYFGFDFNPPPTGYLLLAWVLSIVPSLWMPLKIRRPSQISYWVLYVIVFIPSMFIPLFAGLDNPPKIVQLMLTLFVGFVIAGQSYSFHLYSFKRRTLTNSRFWLVFAILGVLCASWVLVAFRGHARLVSFEEIYDLRDTASDLMSGTLLNYPLMWLYGAINPFLLAFGLVYKRRLMFLVGILGQVLVYSSFGTKASLMSIVFILGIYFLLFRMGRIPFALKFIWGIAGLFLGLSLCGGMAGDEPSLLLAAGLFLVVFRTFGLAGLLTAQYFHFFQDNPFTYYSHIKLVNAFIHYPYGYPLGTEVGYYYYNPLVDTTAHFWATDGIAALGLPGILLASIFFAMLCWFIDSATRGHDPRFVGLAIFYATYSLANLSIFTTVLSGGLGLLVLLLYLLPRENSEVSGLTYQASPKNYMVAEK